MNKQDRALFRPFNTVSDSAAGWELRVYCMGVKDIQNLVGMMARSTVLLETLKTIRETKEENKAKLAQSLGSALLPFINENVLEILARTTKFVKPEDATLEDLPHYAIPIIVEQWVDVNFKEPKQWLPWIEMVENLVKKIPARAVDSTTSIASNS